ncbi:MAG TPA: aminotransferase class III-fold pyridoxal phosphate-dependent enzyme [Candidatus Limnocylindria bacterium]|nr:aminotransferase class III-fold pyridoxal phosphate-dependent enzyme [Candidatus Limnocylindria bacterium]
MGGSTGDLERRYKAVLSPVLGRYTWLQLDRGEGSYLITRDGRRVLDLTCGIAVTPIGHAHPKVVRAVSEQAARLLHISAGVAAYEPNVALAEALVSVTPPGLDMVFFQNSGAEAVEAAVKLARKVTGRQSIVAFRGGFHGRTTGAAALTSSKSGYRKGYGALLPEVHIAPYPYPLACRIQPAHDDAACTRHALDELDAMLEHEVPPEHVAAFLIEPILGEGGYWPAPAPFLRELRALATRIGALMISDEVQTGMGRSGAWLGITRAGVVPDIVTLAKALGGGMPLGAVLAPRALHEQWGTGTHGSTFGGNPVSCAAGLATFGVIRDERLVERADELGAIMLEELAPLRRAASVRDVRATGAMGAVEFDGKPAATAARLGALDRDVLLITCGAHDQVVRFIPPLNIGEDDLRRGLRAFVEAARGAAVAV